MKNSCKARAGHAWLFVMATTLGAPDISLAQTAIPFFAGREVAGTIQPKKISPTPGGVVFQNTPQATLLAEDGPLVDPMKSLMITDLKVVEDQSRTHDPEVNNTPPGGAWAFGTLIRELAKQDGKNADPVAFLNRILDSWETDSQPVNGEVLKKREGVRFLKEKWIQFSGGPARPLDINKAPFRLLAIVNRVDLRDGTPGGAGEARFVFGAIDGKQVPTQFTLIFEYGVSVADFSGLQSWAKRWSALSGGPAATYNARLELITRDFTTNLGPRGARPVAARLNQIRTNEISLAQPWQLREFNIGADGLPMLVPTKKTPRDEFALDAAKIQILTQFLQQNAPIITQQGTHDIPSIFGGQPFLAGKTEVPNPNFRWPSNVAVPEGTRRAFSLNTCNGCHAGETQTRFTHVFPRLPKAESQLSGFLKGITFTPIPGQPDAQFADLERRRQDLVMLIGGTSATEAIRAPLNATH